MENKKIYFAIKLLAVAGIVTAVYLLVEQFMPAEAFRPCTINSTVNCDAVISGPLAKTLGIPTPLYGLAGYVGILLGAIFLKRKLILGLAIFGLLFCLWIGYREIFQLRVICPVCILCQLVMLSIFGLAVALNIKEKTPPALT
ncbi:MAG: vitamin K epoxide reductase family protein [Candidatus Magasanikbacteria bacterium]|nr:vitamin K epoxide reductase family protein [Candidatus Magasanikbacteria bacterium]